MATRSHLVIFARIPRIGIGKTRLARDIGPVSAWHFSRVTLNALLRRLVSPCWTGWFACPPDRSTARYPVPRHWLTVTQAPGDLGQRLSAVMRAIPPGPVVIIGGDAPEVSKPDIAAAFAALRAVDHVIGPASDGGFWLIGAAGHARAGLNFDGVRWSTANALQDMLHALATARVRLLQTLDDVDDGAAFAAWQHRRPRPAPDQRPLNPADPKP
jgi:hypothetical protein